MALNTLAEASATEISKEKSPKGFNANASVARQGGDVAKAARETLEAQLGRTIISSAKAADYLLPPNSVEDVKAIAPPKNDDSTHSTL